MNLKSFLFGSLAILHIIDAQGPGPKPAAPLLTLKIDWGMYQAEFTLDKKVILCCSTK